MYLVTHYVVRLGPGEVDEGGWARHASLKCPLASQRLWMSSCDEKYPMVKKGSGSSVDLMCRPLGKQEETSREGEDDPFSCESRYEWGHVRVNAVFCRDVNDLNTRESPLSIPIAAQYKVNTPRLTLHYSTHAACDELRCEEVHR